MFQIKTTIVLLLSTVLFTGCISFNKDNKEVLRIGVDPHRAPVIEKKGGKYTGFEAEFARLLAAKLNKKPVFVPCSRAKLIDELEKGKIDIIMSGISITEMRQMRVNFTQPYMKIYQTSLFRRSDIRIYSSPQMILLSNDNIGVEENSTGALFAQQSFQPATITAFDTLDDGAKALIKDKIDILIGDLPVICQLGAIYESEGLIYMLTPFVQEYYAWAVAKGNHELLAQANDLMAELKQTGKLDRIITEYFPLYPQLKIQIK